MVKVTNHIRRKQATAMCRKRSSSIWRESAMASSPRKQVEHFIKTWSNMNPPRLWFKTTNFKDAKKDTITATTTTTTAIATKTTTTDNQKTSKQDSRQKQLSKTRLHNAKSQDTHQNNNIKRTYIAHLTPGHCTLQHMDRHRGSCKMLAGDKKQPMAAVCTTKCLCSIYGKHDTTKSIL